MLHERVHSPALSAVDNSAVAALAVAAALDGDRRTAAGCLAVLRGADLASLPRSSSWLVTMNGIVEAASLLDEPGLATQAYDLLLPYADLPLVGGLGVTCFGSAHQALGLACLTAGRLDRAVEHLHAAVQRNLALAHWPALISSRQRLAQACQRRGHQGDAEAARRELDLAQEEATTLGIPIPDRQVRQPAGGRYAECERVGRKWRITLGDRVALVPDSVGLLHLAVLIASPRQDIPAADLVAGLATLSMPAQPVLDQAAIGEYRSRLKDLDAQLGDADAGQAEQARADRDWLVAQLAGATGLAGRTRAFPDDGERARVAAGKAIRRALTRISEADAVIGDHLRESVHTGTRCSYWPS